MLQQVTALRSAVDRLEAAAQPERAPAARPAALGGAGAGGGGGGWGWVLGALTQRWPFVILVAAGVVLGVRRSRLRRSAT